MALLRELGFLPLNARDDFNVLYRFFSRQEFTDEYLAEELELTQVYLEPPQEEAVRRLKGICCGPKSTSCPDQLALGLEQALDRG